MKKFIFLFIFLLLFNFPFVKSVNECEGTISLVLSPNSVESGTEVRAIAGGLLGEGCYNKIIHIKRDSCSGPDACKCEIKDSGCSCSFKAPLPSYSSFGRRRYSSQYTYYACVDKNGDRDYQDYGEKAYTNLTVHRGLVSLPLGILEALKKMFKSILGMFTQVFKF